MELAALQFDLHWENRAANFDAVRSALGQSSPPLAQGSMLILPELFATGFTMNVASAADTAAAETEVFLRELAISHKITVLGGVLRKLPDGSGANEALAFGPDGSLLCRYRKIFPFSPSGEKGAFTAGTKIHTFSWNGFTVAPLICYDLRFPEAFRAATAAGADLFCVMANWPDRRQAHWTTLLRARAIENQAFVLGVNRSGTDPFFHYAGGSMILDPQGATLAEATPETAGASADAPPAQLLRATISPETTASWRAQFPALRDRRPDLFS